MHHFNRKFNKNFSLHVEWELCIILNLIWSRYAIIDSIAFLFLVCVSFCITNSRDTVIVCRLRWWHMDMVRKNQWNWFNFVERKLRVKLTRIDLDEGWKRMNNKKKTFRIIILIHAYWNQTSIFFMSTIRTRRMWMKWKEKPKSFWSEKVDNWTINQPFFISFDY